MMGSSTSAARGPRDFHCSAETGLSMADLFTGATNCAGLGATLSPGTCGADRVAYIAAHETAHFLGLFHTTEMEGEDFDPLADTAKCPCIQCASPTNVPSCGKGHGTPLIDARTCNVSATCGGGSNLMFWLLDSAVSKGTLTAQQGQVMRLNPAVHP